MLQTKVRIYDGTKDIHAEHSEYRAYQIQILGQKFKNTSKYLEVIGTISFQTDRTRVDGEKPWYAMACEVKSDIPEYFTKMAKILKLIKHNSYWDVQPSEVLTIIGAVEYFVFHGDFIPVTLKGSSWYKVYNAKSEYYSIIHAADQISANKEFKKMQKIHRGLIGGHIINEGIIS